ncbi:MAG TPA: hypothetical protein VM529_02785 [Gemmata sp.]|nr:hypothetical protein [Gemmata sp.]
MTDSSRTSRRRKPDRPKKPYPDIPLSPHASGTWQKKIRGKIHYFGRWARVVDGKLTRVPGDGWEDALREYKEVADDLHAGRTPRVKGGGLTVKDLANRFLTAKKNQLDAGELSPRSFSEYRQTTDLLVAQFGLSRLVDDLAAPDFETLRASMARRLGPVRLGNEVQRVRTVFKYAYEAGLVEKPMRYGPQFVKPSKAVMRKHRAKAGPKLFAAEELRKLIDGAGVQMRAMVLLGVNCGYGNTDVATVQLSALDLKDGWATYPRPKTGIARRCALWPETVAALRAVVEDRGKPKGYEACGLVFVNERGSPWVHIRGAHRTDNVTVQFARLAKRVGVHRTGVGFYTLRHVFRTVADEARDPVAIDLIMGHNDNTMGARYRERVDDARLTAITDHVRAWLWRQAIAL